MVRIFIFIFSTLFLVSNILPERTRDKERQELRNLYRENKYKELIPKLELYTESFPEEKLFFLFLAKSYLYRDDLKSPVDLKDPFENESSFSILRENYSLSSKLFSKYIPELEYVDNTQKWEDWYFYWGLSELMLGQKSKAYHLFQKSSKYDSTRPDVYYNMGVLSLETGNLTEAHKNFIKYKNLNEKIQFQK
ncbi:MAG: hypothetical protein H7A24_05615 [Leptospiraceae bacterium]|nr:hypothetical protein [Leptospiraceae bacterium]MCP5511336.1 hypothetical protein [Leptospiraceae bacterium]